MSARGLTKKTKVHFGVKEQSKAEGTSFVPQNRVRGAEESGRLKANVAGSIAATSGRAHRRLQHLYEISKLLTRFETVELTIPAALGIISETLPLRSAILILETEGRPRMVVWQVEGVSASNLRLAKAHARTSYAFITRSESLDANGHTSTNMLAGKPLADLKGETAGGENFILLPLVIEHGRIFGAVQLEGTTQAHEDDLVFVNAVVNQLAISLDRHRAWQLDVALRKRAESLEREQKELLIREHAARTKAEQKEAAAEALAIDNAHLYEQAQRAVHAREEVLAIVSHDVRNPLGAILMNAGRLLKMAAADESGKRSRKYLEGIQRAATRINRLTADLLDLASIEAGQLWIEKQRLAVDPLVTSAVEMMQELATPRSIRLEKELPGARFEVVGDRDRLLQVFSNLIGNAIKFTPEGGSVTIRAESRDNEAWFIVADTGSGIPEDQLPHIFTRYWQGKMAAPRSGIGLGLAIVKGILDALDGRVWVESSVGVGTKFFFSLPLAESLPEPKVPTEGQPTAIVH